MKNPTAKETLEINKFEKITKLGLQIYKSKNKMAETRIRTGNRV